MLVEKQYAKAGTHHPSFSISIRQCLITQKKKNKKEENGVELSPAQSGFGNNRMGGRYELRVLDKTFNGLAGSRSGEGVVTGGKECVLFILIDK